MTFMRLLEAQVEPTAVTLTPGDDHLNDHGTVHGGVLSSLLDACCGATARESLQQSGKDDATVATVNLNVTFMSPAKSGEQLTATAEVTHQGDTLIMLQAAIRTDDGTAVATAAAVMSVID